MKRWIIAATLVATPAYADEATKPEPEKSGRFEVGAGVNPDDGFIAHAAVAHDNLFKTGQQLVLHADVSAVRQHFGLAHTMPNVLGTGLALRSELFVTDRKYQDFTRKTVGGAVTLEKKVGATRVYGRYRYEHVTLDGANVLARTEPGAPVLGSAGFGDGNLATLGGGIEYSTLDQAIPLRGTRVHLWAERADRTWGSDYDLDRAGIELAHARPFGPFTLRLHGSATAVRSRDPLGVPLAHRLFHDGHADVRGYAFDRGTRFGDNREANGTVELELPIWKKAGLSIAGWADAGWRDNVDGGWGTQGSLLQRSVGLSMIWRSPIGPLRFDWAIPLDGDREKQFLFSLGGRF